MLFSIFASILSVVFVGNILTTGISLETLNTKEIRLKPVLIYTAVVSVLTLLAFMVYYPIYTFLLAPFDLTYLSVLIVIFLVIGINELYRLLKFDFLPKDDILPLNSLILLCLFINISTTSFTDSLLFVIGAGLGFVGLSLVITSIQQRLRVSFLSPAFKGLPIALIILGIAALILTAMGGIF